MKSSNNKENYIENFSWKRIREEFQQKKKKKIEEDMKLDSR